MEEATLQHYFRDSSYSPNLFSSYAVFFFANSDFRIKQEQYCHYRVYLLPVLISYKFYLNITKCTLCMHRFMNLFPMGYPAEKTI